MLTDANSLDLFFHAAHPLRRVALVGAGAREHLLDEVLNAVDGEVVLIESTAKAYAHIRSAHPDLVVVCLSGEDAAECQLLSMLSLDRATAQIPVVMSLIARVSSSAGPTSVQKRWTAASST
jgi:hypothetical protein